MVFSLWLLTHYAPAVSRGFPKFSKIGKVVILYPMCSKNTELTGQKKTAPLWSNIVKISNYGIKYTSCQLKIFQKTNLKVKISEISMKFDPRVTWAKFDPSREHAFVYTRLHSYHVFSMKIERKTHRKLS